MWSCGILCLSKRQNDNDTKRTKRAEDHTGQRTTVTMSTFPVITSDVYERTPGYIGKRKICVDDLSLFFFRCCVELYIYLVKDMEF